MTVQAAIPAAMDIAAERAERLRRRSVGGRGRLASGRRGGRGRPRRGRSRRPAVARRHAGRHVYRSAPPGLGVDRGEAATIVSDRDGAVVLDAGNALGQLTGRAGDGDRDRARRRRPASASCRCATASISAPRGRYARQAAEAGLHRHRDVQHAAADAGAGRRRARGRQQSDRDRGADRRRRSRSCSTWRPAKPRWARSAWPRRPASAIPPTWAVTRDGAPTTSPAEAIAGMLLPSGGAEGLRPVVPDRPAVRAAVAAARAAPPCGRSMATSPCRTTARTCSSRSMSRISAIPRGFARSRRGRGRAHSRRAARARRRAAVHAGRARMAPARSARPAACTLGPAVVAMLQRYAGELGVVRRRRWRRSSQRNRPGGNQTWPRRRSPVRSCASRTACSRRPPRSRRPAASCSSPA